MDLERNGRQALLKPPHLYLRDWRAKLDIELEASQSYKSNKADWLDGHWAGFKVADTSDDPRRGITGDFARLARSAIRNFGISPSIHPNAPRSTVNRRKLARV